MTDVFATFLGVGKKTPTVSMASAQEVDDAKKKAKKARVTLTATEGGVSGQELQTGQVASRQTIFGN